MATNVTLKRVSNTDGTTDELHPSTSWGQIDANTIPGDFNPSSHTHGLISNAGKITSNTAIASGDRLVFSNYSDGGTLVNSSITFGTGTTTFLRNDGTWATPNDVDTNNYLTGVSGSGNGTVTFTRSGLSNLTWDASHSHSEYLPLAGGTMTGDLTVTSGNNNGIFIGNGGANITSVTPSSKDIVIQDVSQIRFGSASWDWNSWAGLAFNASTEVLTIGGPASSVFSSNTNPPSIDVNFDGLNSSGLKVNNNTVWHDGIFEPIVDNLDVLPTYTSSNEDFIKYNTTERAIEVQGSDDSFGAVYPAIKTESGVSWKISFSIKASASASSGVYFRIQEYDGALPDGKTHISHGASHSAVQEDTRQVTGFHENQAIGTSWEQHSFFYTPAGTASWFSPLFLNWTGLGNNSLFIKNFRIFAIQEDSADANTLDGLDSTQFLRSDTSDTMTGNLTLSGNNVNTSLTINSGTASSIINMNGTNTSFIEKDTGNDLYIAHNVSDKNIHFRINDGGTQNVLMTLNGSSSRVGIGTTSPNSKLHILGADPILVIQDTETAAASSNVRLRLAESTTGNVLDQYWDLKKEGDNLKFQNKYGTTVYDRFTINGTNGNIGIGTTTPSEKLHIAGDVQISGSGGTIGGSTLANGWLKIGTTLAMDNNEIYFGTTGYVGTIGAYDLILMNNSTERLRTTSGGVDVSGNLGVTGTVDGVDIAAFKTAYDSHAHSQYAPLASPALTGTPTAPTAATNTNNTQIATTAFVSNKIAGIAGGLNFKGTVSLATSKSGDDLYGTGSGQISSSGDYVIVSNAGDITNSGNTLITLAVQSPGDESDSTLPVTLEVGDWIMFENYSSQTLTVILLNNNDGTKASAVHNHSTSQITSGNFNTARLGSGTATSGYVLKSDGDGTASWQQDNNTTYTLGSFGITATAAELNKMDGVTATTAELNKMDGLTATTTELNYVDGVTSNIQTQLDGKHPTITNNIQGSTFSGAYNAPGGGSNTGVMLYGAYYGWHTLAIGSNGQVLTVNNNVPAWQTPTNGTVTSVATGGGLTGGTITGSGTISHADTSTQASVNNSGNTFIQDITLDGYGHITAITSGTATSSGGGNLYFATAHNSSYDYYASLASSTLPTGWSNVGTGNWTFNSGTDTGSGGTGPSGDTTQTGFWYTEMSSNAHTNTFTLRFQLSNTSRGASLNVPRWLDFEYSAYGSNQGTFVVEANGTEIFKSVGDIGDVWMEGKAVIPANASYLDFKVSGATGYAGDVCLCNVYIDNYVLA